MNRSTRVLSLALTGALSFGAFAAPGAAAQSSGSSFGSSGNSPAEPTTPWADGVSEGLTVILVGDVLGEGISDHLDILSGDLGAMAPIGEGEEFAIIFGDSFRGWTVGQGEWMSPVGVVAVKDENGRITIVRPLNEGDRVEQLIDYSHDGGLTLLPSDVINIGGTLYMHAMWNQGLGNVQRMQIFQSTDNGLTWQSVTTIPANYLGGLGELVTWEQGPDGYIYMMSTSFLRKDDVLLTRFRPEDMNNYKAWQHLSFDGATPVWGTAHEPILTDRVKAGEMNLRYIEGHWVLAMFNEERMAIEVRITTDIARDWNEILVADVVTAGFGGWGATQTPDNFSQLYGGYITPDSSLANLDLVVSQWNTRNDSRYMATQFNIKGLDTFFGINQNNQRARVAPQVGDQNVLVVEQTEVEVPTTVELTQ